MVISPLSLSHTLTHTLEGSFQLSQKVGAVVRNMASSGSGVWISLRRSSTVQLFHTVTKTLLQEIDIEKALRNIAASKLSEEPYS